MTSTTLKLEPNHLAYFAGFIDGEGHVGVTKDAKRNYYSLELSASNTVRAPLDMLQSTFGGTVMKTKRSKLAHKDCFVWACRGQIAFAALQQLRPYLLIKAERAWLGMEFFATNLHRGFREKDNKGFFKKQSAEELAVKEGFYLAMSLLNYRGAS